MINSSEQIKQLKSHCTTFSHHQNKSAKSSTWYFHICKTILITQKPQLTMHQTNLHTDFRSTTHWIFYHQWTYCSKIILIYNKSTVKKSSKQLSLWTSSQNTTTMHDIHLLCLNWWSIYIYFMITSYLVFQTRNCQINKLNHFIY